MPSSSHNGSITLTVLKLEFDKLPEDILTIGVEIIDEEWFAEMYTRGTGCRVVEDEENGLVYFQCDTTYFSEIGRILKTNDAYWVCHFESKVYTDVDVLKGICIPWAKTIEIK